MTGRIYFYEDDCLKVAESLARYRFSLASLKNKRVLDIGCGARKGPSVVSKEASCVVGADIAEEAVRFCSKTWASPAIRYLAANAIALPFKDDVFDAVLSFEVIEHISLRGQEIFLKEAARVLKSGGVCIISTPNKDVMSPQGVPVNPDHVKEFGPEEFRGFLSHGFSRVELYGQRISERAVSLETSRKQAYARVSHLPVFVRHLLPAVLRQILFKKYALFFVRRSSSAADSEITEDDFPIDEDDIKTARYMIAVCKK